MKVGKKQNFGHKKYEDSDKSERKDRVDNRLVAKLEYLGQTGEI